jgi:hypothetical protein
VLAEILGGSVIRSFGNTPGGDTSFNRICDEVSAVESLNIQQIVIRPFIGRPRFYLGYPIAKLKWLK